MRKISNASSPIIWGLSSVILGILIIAFSQQILKWIFLIMGAGIILCGAIPLLTALKNKTNVPILSTFYVLIGIIVMALNVRLTAALFVVLGLLLMLVGFQNISSLVSIRRTDNYRIPWGHFVIPCMCIAGGIITIWNPFAIQTTLIKFIGWCILIQGLWNLISLALISYSKD